MSTKALWVILGIVACMMATTVSAHAATRPDLPSILLDKAIKRDSLQETSQFLSAAMILMLDSYPDRATEIIIEAKALAPERAEEIDQIAAHYFAATGKNEQLSLNGATPKAIPPNAPKKGTKGSRRLRFEREGLEPGSVFGLSGWSGEAELGGAFTTGNTEERALDTALKLRRENATWRHAMQGEFDWTNTNKKTSRQRLRAEYQLAYNLARRSYLFALTNYEDDRFSGFDYRLLEAVGIGYRLLYGKNYFLDVEAGATARRTQIQTTGVNQDEYGGRFNTILEWSITDKLTFENEASALLMDDSTTIKTSTGLKVGFSTALAARVRFDFERNSEVPAGKKKTRTKTRVTLVYGF